MDKFSGSLEGYLKIFLCTLQHVISCSHQQQRSIESRIDF
ncbi:hypothetical protein EIKCOROL_00371 [Eikenella corrodens ATCC 23834]|uniref:Uncharacterized protein n=1 Tax=Eikenella corrodens ATCC 23834 TaxID=546274 RepID=C0DSP9_EIKCO|nr:hypothetical protein EIKCOROL_00371 [Eikenella corrodens ATCC 23834]